MTVLRVKPFEVLPGDRYVGFPGRTITGHRFVGLYPYGGDVERQQWGIGLDDGKEIVLAGDSRVSVIRDL